MKHIKLFQNPQGGDNYEVKDTPWISTVKATKQSLYCKKPGMCVNNDDVLDVIYNNQIWYKTVDGELFHMEQIIEYYEKSQSYVYQGPRIISNEYDEEKGWFVITFDDDVSVIGDLHYATDSSDTSHLDGPIFGGQDIPQTADVNLNVCEVKLPCSVTRIGSAAFFGCEELTSIVIGNNVTSIGSSSFYHCSGLTSVIIGENVTNIESYAFFTYGASALTSVTWNAKNCEIDGTTTPFFTQRESITSFIFGDKVEVIPDSICLGMGQLSSVTIPNSVISIKPQAFSGCSGLTSVEIGENVSIIGFNAFGECTNLPVVNGVRYADTCAIEIVDKTATICTIKEGTKYISEETFNESCSIEDIIIPSSVIFMGNVYSANRRGYNVYISDMKAWCNINFSDEHSNFVYKKFGDEGNLYLNNELVIDLIIPEGTTIIKNYAFCGCGSITSVTIPDSVYEIGEESFLQCANLVNINIPNSVKKIGNDAFNYCRSLPVIDNLRYADTCLVSVSGSYLDSYTIKEGTRFICNDVFNDAYILTAITIPDSVISIGENAFYYCNGLTSVDIPNSVTIIGRNAFYYSGLQNIHIPTNIEHIGENAFGNSSVTSITVDSRVLPSGSNPFSGCSTGISVTITPNVEIIGEDFFPSGVSEIHYTGTIDEFIRRTWSVMNVSRFSSVKFDDIMRESVYPEYTLYINDQLITSLTIDANDYDGIIPEEAFRGCTSLTSVTIVNAEQIGKYAFCDCTSLVTVDVTESNLEVIGEYAFGFNHSLMLFSGSTMYYPAEKYQILPQLEAAGIGGILIPRSVTTICDNAFYTDYNLQRAVTIPGEVTFIGKDAFVGTPIVIMERLPYDNIYDVTIMGPGLSYVTPDEPVESEIVAYIDGVGNVLNPDLTWSENGFGGPLYDSDTYDSNYETPEDHEINVHDTHPSDGEYVYTYITDTGDTTTPVDDTTTPVDSARQ